MPCTTVQVRAPDSTGGTDDGSTGGTDDGSGGTGDTGGTDGTTDGTDGFTDWTGGSGGSTGGSFGELATPRNIALGGAALAVFLSMRGGNSPQFIPFQTGSRGNNGGGR